MYKENICSRERLNSVLDALDCLGREYTVTKKVNKITPVSPGLPGYTDHVWTIEEVSKQDEAMG